MGKRFFGVIAFVAIAVAAGWNYQQNANEVALSDLALANIEALARDEGGDYWWCCGYWGNCKADNGTYIHGVFRVTPCQ